MRADGKGAATDSPLGARLVTGRPRSPETIPDILYDAAHAYGDRPAFRRQGNAPAYTYREATQAAERLSSCLAGYGVAKSIPVALLSENRPEWPLAYFGTHLCGATLVPIDARLKPPDAQTILERSGARLLIASSRLRDVARPAAQALPDVGAVVLEDLLEQAKVGRNPERDASRSADVCGDDVAVLGFTSGTTGDAKAIVLTHRNITFNAVAASQRMGVVPSDRLLSILPLSHLFEQTAGLLVPMLSGACITYVSTINPRVIAEAMVESGTIIMLVVPAIMRLFQKRILSSVRDQPRWRRWAFGLAVRLAGLARRARLPIGRLLFRPIHAAFGGKMTFFMCGGAALDRKLATFFLDLGFPVLQGYGLSEAAPIVLSAPTP